MVGSAVPTTVWSRALRKRPSITAPTMASLERCESCITDWFIAKTDLEIVAAQPAAAGMAKVSLRRIVLSSLSFADARRRGKPEVRRERFPHCGFDPIPGGFRV